MTPQRISYLGWDQPFLPSVTDHLVRTRVDNGRLDLADVVCVFPGSRAGRRMIEILAQRSAHDGLLLVPPQVATAGDLPDMLHRPARPAATSSILRRIAWVSAFRKSGAESRDELIRADAEPEDLAGWLGFSEILDGLWVELAGKLLDFGQVADQVEEYGQSTVRRWRALSEVHAAYLVELADAGYEDPQQCRIDALKSGCLTAPKQIVLAGVADMNELTRRMLQVVCEDVEVLVFGPAERADDFDEWGCIRCDRWQGPIELDDGQIEYVDGPVNQAEMVIKLLADLGNRYAADQVTVGVPDERLVPYLEHELDRCDIPSRPAAGRPIAQCSAYKLMVAAADFLQHRTYSALATMARHSDVEAALAWRSRGPRTERWLAEMDEYHGDHLPELADGQPQPARSVYDRCMELLGQLTERRTRRLGEWAGPILGFLKSVYGRIDGCTDVPEEQEVVAFAEKALRQLRDWRDLQDAVADGQNIGAVEAIQILLGDLARQAVPYAPAPEAAELLGWLELPLDDAPVQIITSFNEGFVPGSLNGDAFLPDGLRSKLGLLSNARRFARDAYALTATLACREWSRLIVARRSTEEEPLTISRLGLACPVETMAERILNMEDGHSQSPRIKVAGRAGPGESSRFIPPKPCRKYDHDSMSVTSFGTYLKSPYLFYLKHVLGLKGSDDLAREMTPAAFGGLVHQVLCDFGRDEDIRDSTDADRINDFLSDRLDKRSGEVFGDRCIAAVAVQGEQLRGRLEAFARWQAGWARQGWRIIETEKGFGDGQDGSEFHVPGADPMVLRARIDRIDSNDGEGAYAIWDYKTSESPAKPGTAHRRKGKWINLQLPLYKHLARTLTGDAPVDLGFISLPSEPSQVGKYLAKWTDDELADAERTAAEVIRRVREGAFEEIGEVEDYENEVIKAICGQGLITPDSSGEEE